MRGAGAWKSQWGKVRTRLSLRSATSIAKQFRKPAHYQLWIVRFVCAVTGLFSPASHCCRLVGGGLRESFALHHVARFALSRCAADRSRGAATRQQWRACQCCSRVHRYLPLPIPRSRHQASRVALWNGHPLIAPTPQRPSRGMWSVASQSRSAPFDVQVAAQCYRGFGIFAARARHTFPVYQCLAHRKPRTFLRVARFSPSWAE